jgi:hypothetical protein
MKKLIITALSLLITLFVCSQELAQTNPKFKSDLITFEVIDTMWIRIDPIYNVVDSVLTTEGLNEDSINSKFVKVVNQLRKDYGVGEVTLSQQINNDLIESFVYGQPLKGITWSAGGFFYSYNYISVFDDRESALIRFELDILCVDEDLFNELVNPNATQFGFYFDQNLEEQSFEMSIYIK